MLLVLEIMLVALLITLPVIRFSRRAVRAVTLFRAQELSVLLPVKLSSERKYKELKKSHRIKYINTRLALLKVYLFLSFFY